MASQLTLAKILHLIHRRQLHMANDLSKLQALIDNLTTESATVISTLGGLAAEVIALRGQAPVDQQVAIDALSVKAQAILDNLSAADASAETELPGTVPIAPVSAPAPDPALANQP